MSSVQALDMMKLEVNGVDEGCDFTLMRQQQRGEQIQS